VAANPHYVLPLSKELSPPLSINGNGSLRDIVKSLFCEVSIGGMLR